MPTNSPKKSDPIARAFLAQMMSLAMMGKQPWQNPARRSGRIKHTPKKQHRKPGELRQMATHGIWVGR